MTKTKYATTYYCSAYKKWCELILEISSMIKIHKTQAKINIIILMRRGVAIGDREQIILMSRSVAICDREQI